MTAIGKGTPSSLSGNAGGTNAALEDEIARPVVISWLVNLPPPPNVPPPEIRPY